jgi:hypothetical protein
MKPLKLIMKTLKSSICLLTLSALLMAAITTSASAEETAFGNNWQLGADIYLWGAGIGGKSATGGDIDVDFDTIIKNLDMAFMGTFEARNGKWSFLTDIIYMDVSADNGNTIGIADRADIRVDAKIQQKNWIIEPAIGYTVLETDTARLDVLGGVRFLWLDAALKLDVDASRFSESRQISDSGSVWDGIIGVRGKFDLTPQWYLPYYLDVGTGDSESTWQGLAGVGYKFENFDAVLAYRYLEWNFDDNKVFDDLTISGPMLGAKFRF